ncbi:MAG TPA: hypothetical protein VFL41_11820 [Gaiellaceae bacterium]|nr:hypothetical protein [Gaiellaceae bacterium]
MPQATALTAAAMVTEARGLVVGGWCQGANARDKRGAEVPAWSEDARSWSLLGALLASWHRHEANAHQADVVAHLADAEALGGATQVLGDAVGTTSLANWNDEPARTQADVVGAFDRALRLLEVR